MSYSSFQNIKLKLCKGYFFLYRFIVFPGSSLILIWRWCWNWLPYLLSQLGFVMSAFFRFLFHWNLVVVVVVLIFWDVSTLLFIYVKLWWASDECIKTVNAFTCISFGINLLKNIWNNIYLNKSPNWGIASTFAVSRVVFLYTNKMFVHQRPSGIYSEGCS